MKKIISKSIGLFFLIGFAVLMIAARSSEPTTAIMKIEVAGKGTIEITLATDKAPQATSHVMDLADQKFYDGQKIFNVLNKPKPFLVKFGDPKSKTVAMDDASLGQNGSGTKVPYEDSGLSNVRGAVGLSTQPRDPNSGDSIFYIVLADSKFLDGKYTVFGNVTKGMEIVDALQRGDKVSSVTVVRG